MNNTNVLILNGSPGSGKSTLADAISRELLSQNVHHAVIDLDAFACVYLEEIDVLNNLKWKNLTAVWPNYSAFGTVKVIIPVLIDTTLDLEAL
jgi:DNA replication protein DnaC